MSELNNPIVSLYDLKPGDTVLGEKDGAGHVNQYLFCDTVKRVTAHLIYVYGNIRPYYKKTGAMKGNSRFRIAPYDEKRYDDFMSSQRAKLKKARLLDKIRMTSERMSIDELEQLAQTMGIGP
ncbi:MAG: hypothetical protein WAU60_15965 [Candidatus Competibacter denitrificans]|jgi:hypothetical protein